jgi:outer membrane lipoprotein-sorting protein
MSPRKLSRRAVLAFALTAPLLAPGAARADATDDALAKVTKARKELKTLIARFTQVRQVGLLAEEVKSTGELTVVTPDKLRWELFPPDSIVFWVIKGGVSYKDAKGKVGKAPPGAMGALVGDLITFLGGDIAALKARYDLTANEESDGSVKIVALPKSDEAKKALKRLEVRTNAERWGVSRIVIEEPSGDSSVITFETNKKNEKVDPDKMKPPA